MSDWVFHAQCMRVGSPGCRDFSLKPPQRFWFRFFHNYFADYYLFILLFLLCNEEKCPLLLPVLITLCSYSKTRVWSLGTVHYLWVTYAFQEQSNERHFGENLATKPKMANCFCFWLVIKSHWIIKVIFRVHACLVGCPVLGSRLVSPCQ